MIKDKIPNLRKLLYPIWVIGVVYFLYLGNQILCLFLGSFFSHLLKLPWKLEELHPELMLPNFWINLFLGLIPLLLAFFWAEKLVFRQRFLPRFFPAYLSAFYDVGFGFVLGGLLFALLFLVFRSLNWLQVTKPPVFASLNADLFWVTLTFIVSALFEELFYRGLHLPVFTAHWGLSPGIAFSAFLFSLAHLSNPNLSFLGLFGILIAGVLFALSYLETGALYLPVALHFSWNFFQNLFGFRVSGFTFPSLFHLEITGPPLWTGGAFGPEAGLSGLLLLLLATAAILLYGHCRRQSFQRKLNNASALAMKNRP